MPKRLIKISQHKCQAVCQLYKEVHTYYSKNESQENEEIKLYLKYIRDTFKLNIR